MSSPVTILPFLLLLLRTSTATLTLDELLKEYNFPVVFLPPGLKSFTLNRNTGEFKVKLHKAFNMSSSGLHLMGKSTIKGVISKDGVRKLEGVSALLLFVLVDVEEIVRDGDTNSFRIGFELKKSTGYTVKGYEKLKSGWEFCYKVLGFVTEKMKLLKWSL